MCVCLVSASLPSVSRRVRSMAGCRAKLARIRKNSRHGASWTQQPSWLSLHVAPARDSFSFFFSAGFLVFAAAWCRTVKRSDLFLGRNCILSFHCPLTLDFVLGVLWLSWQCDPKYQMSVRRELVRIALDCRRIPRLVVSGPFQPLAGALKSQ